MLRKGLGIPYGECTGRFYPQSKSEDRLREQQWCRSRIPVCFGGQRAMRRFDGERNLSRPGTHFATKPRPRGEQIKQLARVCRDEPHYRGLCEMRACLSRRITDHLRVKVGDWLTIITLKNEENGRFPTL